MKQDWLHKKILATKVLLIAATCFSLSTSVALAQSIDVSQPAPVQYIVSPENPGPSAPVSIEIKGVGNFLGNSTITWKQNGQTVLSGKGEREYLFTTGSAGKPVNISITIETSLYGVLSKTFEFNPSEINLVWEANTSVPPFYAGKPLASAGSRISVIAFSTVVQNASKVPESSLSYQWKLNDTPQPDSSGAGRSVFVFNNSQLHARDTVSVDVYANNIASGHAEITVPMARPKIVAYLHDPLRGILYNRALGTSFDMPAEEETVRAEPYYFSLESFIDGSLAFLWQINGQETSGPYSAAGELTLRQTGSGQGTSALGVSLQSTDVSKILQAADLNMTVSFGGQKNLISSFFGI